MAFRTLVLPGLFVLRWEVQPAPADFPLLMIAVDAAVAGGAPMALLTLIGQETRAPDGEARTQLTALTPKMVARFKGDCLVIEGTGLLSDTKRLFTRAMLAMTGMRAPLFATASEALLGTWCPPFVNGPAAVAAMKQAGLISS
jgi:hypothetical protein